MTLVMGAYFFLIAFILAHLEIQIEGPHGWAEKLPTWRWESPRGRRWVGEPVTGYHLCLVTCILLFLHTPQFYGGSWEREADLLAMFFLLTVTWDFLWFACNRHYGVGPVSQGSNLVVPGLGARRSPALPHADHGVPLRRARARPVDGSLGGSCPALGFHLRRVAHPDDHRDSLHASPAATALATSSGRPWPGEGQTQVVATLSGPAHGSEPVGASGLCQEASQRRSLRTGPPPSAPGRSRPA